MDARYLKVIAVLALIAVGLFALDQLGLWLERRGWLYYRKKEGSGGRVGNALVGMQSIIEPDKRHVQEIKRQRPTVQREGQEGSGSRAEGPAAPDGSSRDTPADRQPGDATPARAENRMPESS